MSLCVRGGAEKDVMYLYNNNIYTYVFTCCSKKKKQIVLMGDEEFNVAMQRYYEAHPSAFQWSLWQQVFFFSFFLFFIYVFFLSWFVFSFLSFPVVALAAGFFSFFLSWCVLK